MVFLTFVDSSFFGLSFALSFFSFFSFFLSPSFVFSNGAAFGNAPTGTVEEDETAITGDSFECRDAFGEPTAGEETTEGVSTFFSFVFCGVAPGDAERKPVSSVNESTTRLISSSVGLSWGEPYN